MNPELAHLVELDRIDAEIRRSIRGVEAAHEAAITTRTALDEAKRHADGLQAQLSASRDAQHEAERQSKRYRDRRNSATNVLESGIGDYLAAERQIAECTRILDDLETTTLEQMERQDDLVQQMHAASASIAAAQETLDNRVAKNPGFFVAQQALQDALTAERKLVASQLDRELFARYERVLARKKRPVALMDNDVCGACMQLVQPQQRIELRKGRLLECGSCRRWLVPQDEG